MTKNVEIFENDEFRVVEASFEGFNRKRVYKYRIYFCNMYLGTVRNWIGKFDDYRDIVKASFTVCKNSSNLYLER